MEENELRILIQTTIDLEQSIAETERRLKQLQRHFQDRQLKIVASLNRSASAAQLTKDLRALKNSGINLTGKLDAASTKRDLSATLNRLRGIDVKLSGALDDKTTANIQRQLKLTPLQTEVDVDVDGKDDVDKLSDSLKRAETNSTGLASNVYLLRTALSALRTVTREAIQTVSELDAAATDLAMVMGEGRDNAYDLLNEYSTLAKELGATSIQVADAASEWLRQGMSAAETTALIEQSMILSKVGAMESEEATKNLTSAMRGYGLAVEDVAGIVDKLTAVDMRAAVTASDLAVAMSRTANSANLSGISMNRLLGYLATVQEVTQKSAETIGESFKTIFARMGNVRLGDYLSDDGEDLSDVETVLKNFGIALRDSAGDFRNYSDVLDEVYAKWNSFTTVDKRAIANAFAGTRQQENFLVLMENYGSSLEYAGVAAESSGTALEKFAAHEDSVAAKAAAFTAALEGVALDTVDTDLVGDIIEAGTALIEFAEKVDLLKGALLGLGAGGALKGLRAISSEVSSGITAVKNLGTAIQTLRNIESASSISGDTIKTLGTLTRGLSNEQMKLVLTSRQLSVAQMQAILTASGLTDEEAKQRLETLGLAASQGTATVATNGLSTAFTGLGAAIKAAFVSNPIGWIAILISLIPMLVKGISEWHKTSEEIYEEAEENRSSYEQLASEVENLNDELATNKQRIQELQDLGAITLVEQEELDRLVETNSQLAVQIARKKELAAIDATEANEGYVESYEKKTFASGARDDLLVERLTIEEQNTDLLSRYRQRSSGDFSVSLTDEELQKASDLMNRLHDIQTALESGIDGDTGEWLDTTVDYEEHVRELIDKYNELTKLQESGVMLSSAQQEQLESTRTELIGLSEDLDVNLLGPYIGEDEHTAEWQALLDLINKNIYAVEYYSTQLSNLPEDCYQTMAELGSSSSLTADKVTELSAQYPELLSWMNLSGVSADELASHFNALARQIQDTGADTEPWEANFEGLSTSFSEAQEGVQKLYDALEGLNGAETLDMDTYLELVELMPELAGEIHDVESAQEALRKTIKNSKRDAVSAYVSMIVANENWVDNAVNSSAGLADALAVYYGADVTNWRATAESKWAIDAELVKNLSDLWSTYSGYTTEQLSSLISIYEKYAQGLQIDVTNPEIDRDLLQEQIEALKEAGVSGLDVFTEENYRSWKIALELLELGNKDYDDIIGSLGESDADKYVADIEAYAEARKKLADIQAESAKVEDKLSNEEDLRKQISYHKELTGLYKEEQAALHELNQLRRETIQQNISKLEGYGFDIDYDAATNDLFVKNKDWVNQMSASDELKEELYDLIEATEELNEANAESSDVWWDLQHSIKDTKDAIIEALNEIVQEASSCVDSIQDVYETLHSAADEYASSGYITVDTLQKIIALGSQYISYLKDENGQLVINEERIRAVIAAQTERLAIESALSYVEMLSIAQKDGEIERLNELLYATQEATDATWGLVYAQLGLLGLTDDQYRQALHNINAIRSMADSAIQNIGRTSGEVTTELEDMKQGLDDILQYVMDMMQDMVEKEIDALEGQKDAFSELIELRKEALQMADDEANREKEKADRLKEIAKLQAKIDMLSLDDSREAQAERAALMEELAELQDDLDATQGEYALELQEKALDDMEEAYHEAKDEEIKMLEDSISSEQKLYDMAIDYIKNNWGNLYNQLSAWNYEYGSALTTEIKSAWDQCLVAAQRYGSFVSALGSIDADISASQSSGGNYIVGSSGDYDISSTNTEKAHATIKEMYANAQAWASSDKDTRAALEERNIYLGSLLTQYGIDAYRDPNTGVWYVGNEKLFEKYRQYCFHTGGIVGGGNIKANEQLALLEDEEWVLSKRMVKNLSAQIERIRILSEGFDSADDFINKGLVSGAFQTNENRVINHISNQTNYGPTINFGPVDIHEAQPGSANEHIKVDRQMVNEIARILKIKL